MRVPERESQAETGETEAPLLDLDAALLGPEPDEEVEVMAEVAPEVAAEVAPSTPMAKVVEVAAEVAPSTPTGAPSTPMNVLKLTKLESGQ